MRTHPAIQMPIPLHHTPLISLAPERISQQPIAEIRALWRPRHILGAREQKNWYASQAQQPLWRDQVLCDGKIRRHVPAHSLLRDSVQERHVHATEEAIQVAVRSFIEVTVAPEPVCGKSANDCHERYRDDKGYNR
jgi:hypothetical protein